MSRSPPRFDPYLVLGVDKDASLAEIKAAHRKLVLKCHPDKVKDESLRDLARDKFQRVQEAYELLSDENRRTRYDQQVRLEALKKEAMERAAASGEPSSYSSSRGTAGREYRDGRIYEERTPAGASSDDDDDDDEIRFSEEPRAPPQKHDDHAKRPTSKDTEEKKKKKSKSVPVSTSRTAKESGREHGKASHHSRAKRRTKGRRREFKEKHEQPTAAYVVSDSEYDSSASDASATIYIQIKRSSRSRQSRDPSPRRSKTEPEPSRQSEARRHHRDRKNEDGGESSDEWESKFNYLQSSVKEYIQRSKTDPPVEVDRRPQFSHSPHTYGGYESSDWYEREGLRHSSWTHRTESARVATSSPPPSPRSQRKSHERLDSTPRTYERTVPSMPTATSSPKVSSSSSRPPPQPTRSSTAPYPRSRRESRSEANPLFNMVSDLTDTPSPRTKLRGTDRNDSGYSSPGTPEMPQSSSSPPKVNRYKIVDPPETITVEPQDSHRYQRSSSPPRAERPSVTTRAPSKPTRTATYSYPEPTQVRYETARPSTTSTSTSRAPPVRVLYGEVRYAREIKPEHIQYMYPRYEERARRQPAY
ncbi:hypothetical protein VTN77DRAFT_5794 [Rasamsonia byssochlamydoides]|uniref:uncharacterized protein n=1 Tax=Rasamsonia byssochlamydoides TaxID=89139 RepID=UPI0037437ABB